MRSSSKGWALLSLVAVTLFVILGGSVAKADVVYGQSCASGQCGIQSAPQALLTPLLVSPTVQSFRYSQSASYSTGSCGTQSASYSQTSAYSSGRPGFFRRIFSRGSARSCK